MEVLSPVFDLLVSSSVVRILVGFFTAIVVAIVSIRLWRADRAPKGMKLPPVFSSGIPVFGNFIEFARDPLGFVEKGRKKCGKVFTIDMVAEKCTFLIGAEAHKVFFEASDEELDQSSVYSFMTPIFGRGIVYDCSLKKRRQQMRALAGSLRPSFMKTYAPMIAKETHKFLEKNWGDSGTVNINKSFADLVIMTASTTLLGPEVRGEMFNEMSHLYEQLDKGLQPLSIFFPHAPTSEHRNRDTARVEISALFSKIIKKRRYDVEAASKNTDVIQKLMDFKYSDGSRFTDDEITGMIIATLFAGQHTSSIVSTWSLLFLLEDAKSKGAVWMNKVLDELASLEEVPGSFAVGEALDHTIVGEEQELYKVVKEAIRMHPPLIMLMRRVMSPLTMSDGTYIPAGHRAMVSNAIAQRLPEVFPNPNEFDPSRWDDFNIAKLPKYSFIGFGAGIHTCMGEPFAFMQVKTILSVILSKYELELVTPFPEPDFTAMVVPPKGPNMVRFKRRENPLRKGVAKVPRNHISEKQVDPVDDSKTLFTVEEVAAHNTKGNLWIIVKGKVYDVTNYIDLHQGGDAALINWGGKDATEAVYGPQHPSTVATLLNRFEIGHLKL